MEEENKVFHQAKAEVWETYFTLTLNKESYVLLKRT